VQISLAMPEHRGARGRLIQGAALGAGLALVASGCSGDNDAAKDAAKVTIAPVNGMGAVLPDSPISVRVARGTLQNVTVTTRKGKGEVARPSRGKVKVEGAASSDGVEWRSRWTLNPDAEYQVTATALGKDGKTKTVQSVFRTVHPKRAVNASLTAPFDGETVGVGMPIMLHFDHKVVNKAQVERALEVRSTKPVEGAWHWYTGQDVFFRTKKLWPSRTKVRLIGHLSGVRAAKDTWGVRNVNHSFKIGDKQISVASENMHNMIVKKNGKKVRNMPISMGRGGSERYTTTTGTHLAMEKSYMTHMVGPGYSQDVYWTIRISDSGEFVHSAPWSVGSQGSSNVSHGCVNASPGDAIWFYHFTNRGDLVRVTGTSRELSYDNGWGFWQMPFKRWVKGSALKRPIRTLRLDGTAAPVTRTAAKPPARPPAKPAPRAANN
jgi:lipoprotein-anchoring transpeptidase ErfK/SrfK